MAEQAEQPFADINGRRYRAFRRQAFPTGLAGGLIGVVTSLLVLWYQITAAGHDISNVLNGTP